MCLTTNDTRYYFFKSKTFLFWSFFSKIFFLRIFEMGCAQSRKGGCCGLNSSSSSSSDIKLKMRIRGRFLSSKDSQNCKILYDNAIAYHQYVSRFDPYKDRTRKLLVRLYLSFFYLYLSHLSSCLWISLTFHTFFLTKR